MIKRVSGPILLAILLLAPVRAKAGVEVNISLPMPIVFAAPPVVVVIPGTYVYAVPDIDEDIFFYNGWWWRPWEGRWYRSRHYDSGWAWYRSVPSFHSRIPPRWRNDYREHRWGGREWNYRPIPHQDLQRNWRSWEKSRHWERRDGWGVKGMNRQARPQPPSRQAAPPKSRPEPRAVAPQPGRPQSREADGPREPRPQPRAVEQPRSRPDPREMQQRQPRRQQPESRQPSRDRQADPDGGHDGRQRDR
jgi:hypothetical protein